MADLYELDWLGGASERYFRRIRPQVLDLPWGTLDPSRYPPLLVDRARVSWTEASYNEYCTAVAFTEMLNALLAAQAPIDLIAMASDFLADEMLHTELTARVAMELGGGAPYRVHFDQLTAGVSKKLSALQRANELVVRICCVGEAFSLPMLAGCQRSASHPLTSQILQVIVEDEAPHGRFGWLYLDWIAEELDEAERTRLATKALATIRQFEPYWKRLRSTVVDGRTTEGFELAHVRELGWMEAQDYAVAAQEAVLDKIVRPLARYGIELDPVAVDGLLDERAPKRASDRA